MTPAESRLGSNLMNVASEECSNHGCNDFAWPDWFPVEERAALVWDMEMANSGDAAQAGEAVQSYAQGKYAPPDWWLMSYFSKKLSP